MSLRKSASFAMLAVLAAAAFPARAKEIAKIRFAVDPSYPPFESKQSDGKLAGFDIDLGNALCEQMKVKCVWVENNFDGMIPGLKARKFNAVLSDMGITEERLKQIDFTVPLYDTHAQLVARAGSGILPTPQALKGKRVGVEQGTVQKVLRKGKMGAAGQAVRAGRPDRGRPRDHRSGHGHRIGLCKGDKDLQISLNNVFVEIKKNGTFKRTMAKYFSPLTSRSSDRRMMLNVASTRKAPLAVPFVF